MTDLFRQPGRKPLFAGPCWRLELLRSGWPADQPIELAAVSKPALVRHIADATLDAGATLLLTPTDSANRISMRPGVCSVEQLGEINRAAAKICGEAIKEHDGKDVRLMGVLGPSEALIALDEVRPEMLEAAYAEQVGDFAAADVDAVVCRHFTELAALLYGLRASRKADLPVIACLTFDSGLEGGETALGNSVPQACAEIGDTGADLIGCDDGDNADAMPALIANLRRHIKQPIWAGLAAGGPQLIDGVTSYPETPEEYAARLGPIVAAGANIIGLGAGASLDHLREIARPRKDRK